MNSRFQFHRGWLLAGLLLTPCAQGQSGGDFTLEKTQIGAGGGVIFSEQLHLAATLGQPLVNPIESDEYSLNHGFWSPQTDLIWFDGLDPVVFPPASQEE